MSLNVLFLLRNSFVLLISLMLIIISESAGTKLKEELVLLSIFEQEQNISKIKNRNFN
ncbi:MAG: Uncharacterised protein [Flavobacteriales bacterium]|nr:MAG: Uncharacterised protein [Flavobacteriales bacterium]